MEEIVEMMNTSLKNLFKEAEILISRYTKEEAINHRLAVHIENYLINFKLDFNHSVDVEYNRNLKSSSLMNHYKDDKKDYVKKIAFTDIGVLKEVIPYIIIHERGSNENNFLCIEAKKKYRIKTEIEDFSKIIGLINKPYNYKYGCLVEYLPNEDYFCILIVAKQNNEIITRRIFISKHN